jgi:hypothetical protein
MPKTKNVWKQKFALKPGGAPRLEFFSEEGEWKNVSVRLDGKEIGKITNKAMLGQGVDFNLENGSILRIQLKMFFGHYFPELYIFINGKPVPGSAPKPGSASHTNKKFIEAYSAIFGTPFFNVMTLVTVLFSGFLISSLYSDTFFWYKNSTFVLINAIYLLIGGIIFTFLGFLVKAKSKIALICAVIFYGIDIILFLWNLYLWNSVKLYIDSRVVVGLMIMRIYFLITMWEGIKAIDDLKRSSL